MNLIEKALRYIYIYILTHANAGWAYDRQSREVWKRRNSEAVRRACAILVSWRVCLLYSGRRSGSCSKRFSHGGRYRNGCRNDFYHRGIRVDSANRNDERNVFEKAIDNLAVSGWSLTSKGVAA